ncbi:hypothetical protein pEaSNUABM6_00263 [Erwinia phage pEa_SNUABM_6]|nr:hypothetical protein pEaSNUABM6_00263 [Erwinia phage pEa_SNUABM_6]
MAEHDASLDKWFLNQLPRVAKKLTIKGIETPPLHIGGQVRVFTPRLPNNPAPGEDQTIPRVCCSLTVKNCCVGARHNFQFANENPRLFIYAFDERSIVQPSVEVTKEPNRAGEVWIVPHRMANWEIKPRVIGEMRLANMAKDYTELDYVLMVSEPTVWENGTTLKPDTAYHFKVVWSPEFRFTEPKVVPVAVYHDALNAYTVSR